MSAAGQLPENGDIQIGPVRLPEGRRTLAWRWGHSDTATVAWTTIEPVPDPGGVWAELSTVGPHIGLIPFIAKPDWREPHRPWDNGTTPPDDYFNFPADLAEVDQIDPAVLLRDGWARNIWLPTEEEEPNPWRREYDWNEVAPYTHDFPGLAPAVDDPLEPALVAGALADLPPARIGLVAARRPADALAALGWYPGNWTDGVTQVTAVLRSWEDRFGTRPLVVGPDSFKLLAHRPPSSLELAQRVAAEIHALMPSEYTCGWAPEALTSISDIANSILRSPIWGFWWD